jgi:hypothetical protein
MDSLSQNELIGLVALIRDKEEYQQKIYDYNLLNELHMIVHHEQSSKNKYHGIWSDELKNKVIHQILYRIIPKDERENFTKDHPLLSKINELIEDNKRGDKNSFTFFRLLQQRFDEIRSLKKRIKIIETTEINDFIEKIADYENKLNYYEMYLITPLIKLDWIDENMNIYNDLIKKPDVSGTGDRKTIYSRNMCSVGGGLDMVLPHRLYFKELCDNYSNEYFMNEKYKEKVCELMKEINTLKQDNDKIRKDNYDKIKKLFIRD